MYSITISSEDAGKTIGDILAHVQHTDEFKQKLGSEYSQTSCLVALDDMIIPYPDLDITTVQAGQSIKLFHLMGGG